MTYYKYVRTKSCRWLLLMILFALPLTTWADEIPIRYVKTTGTYGADGKSWNTAMNDVQEAIEALYTYMTENKLTEGRVYVAEGRYFPSRSTEVGNDNRQHLSFLIRPGVHVFGGFAPGETNDNVNPYSESGRPHDGSQPWNFQYKTVLSGNLTEIPQKQDDNTQIMVEAKPEFTYDSDRGTYKTIFYGNSYHVVWFATNGFIDATKDVNYGWDETGLDGHARALPQPASIDGCTITGGYAATKSNAGHPHTAYGAGAYMVEGASLLNCVIEKCLAMTNGGGVYMDGGGLVDHCYINTCQATGQSALQGFGGGVCINYNGAVTRSYIVNNSSNSGGGVAICHINNEYPWHSRAKEEGVAAQQINSSMVNAYSPHVTACVISNNSSTKEAGGIYLNNGGLVNHLTITNNKCFGADVTYYGRRQGRSGGIYILNGGQIYNSVIWGNVCDANSDIQYACHTSGSTETIKPQVFYSGFDKHETTDWSGTTKDNVYSIAGENTNVSGNNAYYSYFLGTDGECTAVTNIGAGLETIPQPISWKPAAISNLVKKGMQVSDALSGTNEWFKNAHTDTDLLDDTYEPVSILGALVAGDEQVAIALARNQEKELYGDYEARIDTYTDAVNEEHSLLPDEDVSDTDLPTIFVDPSKRRTDVTTDLTDVGQSWDKPMTNINEAIDYFRKCLKKDGSSKIVYDGDGNVTYVIGGQEYKYVQILVKGAEGSLVTTTAGQGGYLGGELRTAAIRPCSNMRIYGGYPPDATGTDTSDRNQRQHPTRISANIINGDYANNSTHVFALTNVKNVIIDGFRIYEGNANLAPVESGDVARGGGIIMDNESVTPDDRIAMTDNILRNSAIVHCSAPDGAAIYVNSAGGLDAKLHLLNVVIRNNTVGDGSDGKTGGVVTARGANAVVRMDHCDLLNNCGYPMETLSTDGTTSTEGQIIIYNSVIYANGDKDIENRKNIFQPLCYRGTKEKYKGKYIYLDWDAVDPFNSSVEDNHIYKVFCRDMSAQYQKWGTRQVDSEGNTVGTPQFSDSEPAAQSGWSTPVLLDYPFFENPAKNVGHSEEGDKPMNGGRIDYMPQATNPMVNAAIDQSRYLWDTDNIRRDYGGDPDIGAVECTELLKNGAVIYVTPDGAGRRDGSSWDNAIAGNTVYMLDGVTGPGLATGDKKEEGSNRIIKDDGNTGDEATPVLTTDEKYCGGFAEVWVAEHLSGGGSTTTITKTWTTEKNVYDNGNIDDEIVQEDTEPTETTIVVPSSEGEPVDGFTPHYEADSRYPYGEISGNSRTFWRANPYTTRMDEKGYPDNKNAAGTAYTRATFIAAENREGEGFIKNDRQEKYVGGLQYAVEKAAALNKDITPNETGDNLVQVWISNGKYTDYKGFIMRDKTTVMGSFPAVKNGAVSTPGINERHALMSDFVPKTLVSEDLSTEDYETILQISDVNPKNNDKTFNEDAVKFWDDDYQLISASTTINYEYKDHIIKHHYRFPSEENDITNSYIYNPAFEDRPFTNYTTSIENGIKYYDLGKMGKWYLSHPNKTNYVANIETDGKTNRLRNIYDPTNQKNQLTTFTGNWIFISNGSLTDLNLWQTIPNLPAGNYKLSVDMAGGYRNAWTSTDDTNIFFHIFDANEDECIEPVMIKTRGSYANSTNDNNNRNMAYRYIMEFNQPIDGPLTIKLVVEDGVRNTKAANADYGTDNGGDPAEIPLEYKNSYGANNPNRREFWMSNIHLYELTLGDTPELVSTDEETTDRIVDNPEPSTDDTIEDYFVKTHRTSLRKRVLTMPDVTIPTYGTGSNQNPVTGRGALTDDLPHTDRVKGAVKDLRTSSTLTKYEDPNYVGYTNVYWNGFTIRNGFMHDEGMGHGGGAGVNMYEGAHLQNCIIYNNIVASERVKGGGMFCDGATSSIENCFVFDNVSNSGTSAKEQNQRFAGGLFMYEGTCFNTLIARNYSDGSAGGIGFCVGLFFNNTIAYNTCNLKEDGNYSGGAISLATASNPNLFVANTIIYGNNGVAIRDRATPVNSVNPFLHCYIQSEVAQPNDATKKNVNNWTSSNTGNYGIGNIFLNGVAPSAANTPFAADIESGSYDADNPGAKVANDFRLASNENNELVKCINSGTSAFASVFKTALINKGRWNDSQFIYNNVANAKLPDEDVAFSARIQDCQIDIGAYEYDGTMAIHPNYELIDCGKRDDDGNIEKELCAVYYVSENGNSAGDSSGSSPENAACATKLQDVLDAAGRLKYDLSQNSRIFSTTVVQVTGTVTPKKEVYNSETGKVTWQDMESQDLSNVKHVIVKLADGVYMPDRSTNDNMAKGISEDEILTHSLIIPHGVEVWGGYQFKNDSSDPTDFFEYTRDILSHKSIIKGDVENKRTGTIGKAYHVVTFTNHLYDLDGGIYDEGDLKGENKLATAFTDTENNRAILDGVFIQGGEANGVNDEDKIGGAGVVTGYAHIRNCIIQDNTATMRGGAFYLMPGALMSGCIMQDNSAEEGGAIYVVEPTAEEKATYTTSELRDNAYARVYNSTIVYNTASVKGGGIFFDTNIRAKGVVLWQNLANDMNNVAGTFDSEAIQAENNYPFSYCAVQNRRLPGVNNQEVSGESADGVRWNSSSSIYWNGESTNSTEGFYYTDRVSALVRTGMPYTMYENLRTDHPSLELTDIVGVYRMGYETDTKGADYKSYFGEDNELVTKANKYLEIGARALNTQMDLDVESAGYHMTRLFVAKPENVNSTNANILLTSGDPLYSMQGSSMANPFTKFSDALDYIVKLRNYKSNLTEGEEGYDDAVAVRNKYANTRFEIFVSGGNYYPYQNARGFEGNARSSTFVLPEGVTIIGGLRPDRMYCQAGYEFDKNQPEGNTDEDTNDRTEIHDADNQVISSPGITLVSMETDDIREARPRYDINDNNVYEPWEFEKETVFSGNTPRGNENEDNVFHVFTCFADPAHVGTLPTMYSDESCQTIMTGSATESQESLRRRMIILDGVTIKEGNARDYEDETIKNIKMFYRGGGIMVDGSWKNAEGNSGETNADAKGVRDIPLVISSSLFQDNNGIQGGAIFTNGTLNVFSSSFVQNIARGPVNNVKQTSTDRTTALAAIQYVGGGAIATTADLLCVNTIFANNEAMLGDTQDLLTEENSRLGFEKQGFGGVIWGGTNSTVCLLNCNLVNNQAVSYPGIYLMSPNNKNDMHHFCVNTVFWGNKATGVPSNLGSTFSGITEISDDVVKFRTMAEKRSLVTPQGVETLYFCAYEEGKGPQDVKASENITYNGKSYDPHAIPFSGDRSGIRNSFVRAGVYYNNNVIITPENEGVDGPNFLRPSTGPGRDGYSADANWMASRVNKLTDNGWSYLTVAPNEDDEMKFKVETEALQGEKAFEIEPDNTNSGGVFNYNSYKVNERFHLNLMPLGSIDLTDEESPRNYYMKFKGSGMTDQVGTGGLSFMQRISSNPLSRDEYEAYIDIGVYEYQHRTLKINQGSEIDVIWITDTEDPEKGNDGYTWETATSNVQVAIETLLKSRNDHGKRLNIIAGSYKPMTVVGDNLGYTLQTSAYNDGVYTPFKDGTEGNTVDKYYGVKYINLRGGYDKEIPDENGYNYQKNQVVFSMEPRTGVKEDALNHILNIADIEQFETMVETVLGDVVDQVTGRREITNIKKPVSRATGKAIPVIVEGITFENAYAQAESETNKGGAAISYKTQYQHKRKSEDPNDPNYKVFELDEENPLGEPEGGLPKITIRNCTFSQNGKTVSSTETPASAVRIEKGGGQALIVNSVFHSNKGKPVDAVNTVILNCTSAMNGGHITLKDETGDQSELHNSVIWQDDQNVTDGSRQQFEVPTSLFDGTKEPKKRATEKMSYNAITGLPLGLDDHKNEPLSNTNNDLEEGPNFLFMNPNDPDPDKRDFRIRPSLKLLDKGNNPIYARFVWPTYSLSEDYLKLMRNTHDDQTVEQEFTTKIREGNEVKVITYRGFKHDKDLDRAFVTRLLNDNIDRGAYECTGRGQRVIYVNPEKFGTGMESGSTWEDALGRGNLQRAVDAAAVYVRNNSSTKKAYVFVRGDNVYNEGEITIRDGVEVYGTAPITIEAVPTPRANPDDIFEYTENELKSYVNRVKATRSGIVFKSLKAESFTPTYCSGLVSMGDYKLGSVFDGLMINNGISNTAEHPVVDIADDAKVAIRNCIIIHNKVGNDNNGDPQPVVNLAGGLLYNSLVYDGFGGDVVKVGANGYVLNCTVIAEDKRQIAVTYSGESGSYDGHVKNTIAVNEGASKKMFAPYLQEGANAYTPASHLTSHPPYGYQLHEKSAEIDAATLNTNTAVDEWLPVMTTTVTEESGQVTYSINYDQYVDIEHDRDLLGNPRIINGTVDNGCFETWLVKENETLRTETRTNFKADLTKYVSDVAEGAEGYDADKMVPPGDYWKNNFGGNYYPHAGSVVYIEKNANLVLDKIGSDPMFGEDNPIVPGYLLIKEGGSLYGQGSHVTATYVAVEKTISSQYSLISVPYKCDPNSTVAISYSDGAVSQTRPSGMTGSTYDGEQRSKWDYHFKEDDSDCWKPQGDFIPANTGWLLSLSEVPASPTTYRFTGWGDDQLDYIYTEDGSDKTVTLTQYNNLPDDGSAHFTKEENMGWNLIGLPWLVSGYATNTLIGGTYAMNVPHVFYGNLAKGLTEPATGSYTDGQFYTRQSWADGSTLSPGEGVFMQTAVLDETETLTFKLPVYVAPSPSRARQQIGVCRQSGTRGDSDVRYEDVVDVYPQEGADAAMSYRLGADGIKWMAFNESVAQIYVENAVGTRLSLVSAAPVETEISLGVKAPEAGDYVISLPEPEAYSDYEAVWVIDDMTGASANLLAENFILSVHQAGDFTNRLKLKFGGMRPEAQSEAALRGVIKVAARHGRLPMPTIADHEMIRIYNPTGALIFTGPASDSRNLWLPDGVYIIQRDL